MNDSIIGLTLEQVDAINFMKIDRDERIFTIKLYTEALLKYDSEAVKYKSYIKSLEAAGAENERYIKQLKSDLEKSNRQVKLFKNITIFTVPLFMIAAIIAIVK